MKRIYVNEEWCLGCHLCEFNCAFANSGLTDMVKALKGKKINPCIRVEGDGKITYAVNCRHCYDAICVKSCIAGAITRNASGATPAYWFAHTARCRPRPTTPFKSANFA